MANEPISHSAAADLAREVIGPHARIVEQVPLGFGNSNWRVRAGDVDLVLKIGPRASTDKWAAGERGRRLAAAAGVPVPEIHDVTTTDHHVVRTYRWIDGAVSPRDLDQAGRRRFGRDLGAAVGALHELTHTGFSSRIGGSALVFDHWSDYCVHRLGQITVRAGRSGNPPAPVVSRVVDEVERVVHAASGSARAVTCHRDLHVDNLLAGPDGHLRAILDWDMPEAWDEAGEWFKLDWMLFPAIPEAQVPFEAAYRDLRGELPDWDRRVRLVHLIETLNVLANSGSRSDADLTSRAADHLDVLLTGQDDPD
ncbi:MAG: aminoglycoside phosphotransferase family protein [Actinomycetota bacterium]